MKITQVFKSASDAHTIGNIKATGSQTLIPIPGDVVSWVVDGKTVTGRVKSRVLSYSAPEMAVARDDDFEVTATFTVEME